METKLTSKMILRIHSQAGREFLAEFAGTFILMVRKSINIRVLLKLNLGVLSLSIHGHRGWNKH